MAMVNNATVLTIMVVVDGVFDDLPFATLTHQETVEVTCLPDLKRFADLRKCSRRRLR